MKPVLLKVPNKGPTTLAELENEREQLRAQREQAKQAELEKLATSTFAKRSEHSRATGVSVRV